MIFFQGQGCEAFEDSTVVSLFDGILKYTSHSHRLVNESKHMNNNDYYDLECSGGNLESLSATTSNRLYCTQDNRLIFQGTIDVCGECYLKIFWLCFSPVYILCTLRRDVNTLRSMAMYTYT